MNDSVEIKLKNISIESSDTARIYKSAFLRLDNLLIPFLGISLFSQFLPYQSSNLNSLRLSIDFASKEPTFPFPITVIFNIISNVHNVGNKLMN